MLKIILWLISQLVLGNNNCCAAIFDFESPLLLTLQKYMQAIQYVALKISIPVLAALQGICV